MKSNEAIFEHFSAVLDEVIGDSNFLKAYYQDPYSFDGCLFYTSKNVTIASGVSRSCVIDDDYDYVVKFDIQEDELYGSVCEREVKIYAAAQEAGLAQYFTSARYIGTYERDFVFYDLDDIYREADICCFDNNEDYFNEIFDEIQGVLWPRIIHFSFPLYAYQKANCCYNRPVAIANDKDYSYLRAMNSPLTTSNLQIGIMFLTTYGMDEYKRFSRFASAQHINDLHFGNIGFIDGKIRFIDYGGFHNSCDIDPEYVEEENNGLYN